MTFVEPAEPPAAEPAKPWPVEDVVKRLRSHHAKRLGRSEEDLERDGIGADRWTQEFARRLERAGPFDGATSFEDAAERWRQRQDTARAEHEAAVARANEINARRARIRKVIYATVLAVGLGLVALVAGCTPANRTRSGASRPGQTLAR